MLCPDDKLALIEQQRALIQALRVFATSDEPENEVERSASKLGNQFDFWPLNDLYQWDASALRLQAGKCGSDDCT